MDLTGQIQTFTQGRIFADKRVVISGLYGPNIARIIVIDISTGKLVDSFYCYVPSISPDGRYVAFVKFYPAHGVTHVEDHYGLYDLQHSPKENRPTHNHRDLATVGKILFPINMGNIAGDNVELARSPLHEMAGERFFWSNNSRQCVFVDRMANIWTAVMFSTGAENPSVLTYRIPSDELCDPHTNCVQRLLEAKFADPEIELSFRDFSGRSAKSTQIHVPRHDFRPAQIHN